MIDRRELAMELEQISMSKGGDWYWLKVADHVTKLIRQAEIEARIQEQLVYGGKSRHGRLAKLYKMKSALEKERETL